MRTTLPRPRAGLAARPGLAALLALVVGAGLRLLLLAERRGGLGPISLGSPDPEWGSYVLDAAWYDEMARRVAGLDGGAGGLLLDAPFPMAPLYGYALALVYAVFGADDPTPVFALQALGGGLTAGLAALLAAALVGRGAPGAGPSRGVAALVAGLAVATYPVALHYDITLLGVGLATLATTAAALALVRAWRPGSGALSALVGGLSLGVAITARANLLVVAPFVLAAFGLRALRAQGGRARALASLLALGLGVAAPVALCAAHNQVAGGELVLVSANGGINLYRGNNPHVVDQAVHAVRLPADRDAIAEKSRLIASRDSGRWLSPAEADRYWQRRALDHWRQDPARYLGLFLRKLHQALSPREVGDDTELGALAERSAVLSRLPWLYGPLAVSGLLGLGLLGLGRVGRAEGARRPGTGPGGPDLPAALLLVVGLASVALFFVLSRYRLALAPILFAYAGVAVAWGLDLLRGRRWRPLAASAALAGGLGLVLGLDPLTPWLPGSALADRGYVPPPECALDTHLLRAPRIEAEYRRAKAELLSGKREAAGQRLGALLQADPGHLPAAVDLAALLLERGDPQAAVTLSEAVLRADPCDDKAWANLGTARLRQGRPRDAARAFERARELDPYAPEYEAALGEALLVIGEEERALPLLDSAVRWGPELWQPRAILGRRAFDQGRYAEAEALLRVAVEGAPTRVELHAMLGLSLLGQGDLAGARRVLDEAKARGMGRQAPILALEKGLLQAGAGRPAGSAGGDAGR